MAAARLVAPLLSHERPGLCLQLLELLLARFAGFKWTSSTCQKKRAVLQLLLADATTAAPAAQVRCCSSSRECLQVRTRRLGLGYPSVSSMQGWRIGSNVASEWLLYVQTLLLPCLSLQRPYLILAPTSTLVQRPTVPNGGGMQVARLVSGSRIRAGMGLGFGSGVRFWDGDLHQHLMNCGAD